MIKLNLNRRFLNPSFLVLSIRYAFCFVISCSSLNAFGVSAREFLNVPVEKVEIMQESATTPIDMIKSYELRTSYEPQSNKLRYGFRVTPSDLAELEERSNLEKLNKKANQNARSIKELDLKLQRALVIIEFLYCGLTNKNYVDKLALLQKTLLQMEIMGDKSQASTLMSIVNLRSQILRSKQNAQSLDALIRSLATLSGSELLQFDDFLQVTKILENLDKLAPIVSNAALRSKVFSIQEEIYAKKMAILKEEADAPLVSFVEAGYSAAYEEKKGSISFELGLKYTLDPKKDYEIREKRIEMDTLKVLESQEKAKQMQIGLLLINKIRSLLMESKLFKEEEKMIQEKSRQTISTHILLGQEYQLKAMEMKEQRLSREKEAFLTYIELLSQLGGDEVADNLLLN